MQRYKKRKKIYRLERPLLKQSAEKFFNRLDRKYGGFKDSDLSFTLLIQYYHHIQEEGMAKDAELHDAMVDELRKLAAVGSLRNNVAHVIVNVTRESFQRDIQMTPPALMNIFARMLCLAYGTKVQQIRTIYSRLYHSRCALMLDASACFAHYGRLPPARYPGANCNSSQVIVP